jgi:hypothetical protein
MPNPMIKVFNTNGELVEEREMTDAETAERQARIDELWGTNETTILGGN